MKNLPTGTITFLFTDIEGSTKLWEEHPEAMKIALAQHDSLLQQAIESYNGCVFKMVGDAFCASFPTAPDALDAALAAQRSVSAEAWGDTPIRVRMALHTGMAEERNGDYFGPPLNRVARLLSAGYGGQTLLSLATQELVRDQLPQGASLIDLGQHRLKDLFRPEHVYQLSVSDLTTEFPPLRTLDAKLTNLPAQPTPLIGLEREVAAILALLRRDDVRLVTLTGTGGTGKTRLSLQVAADLLDEYEHGVWFVDLSPIIDPALVVSTIAGALGVRESGSQPLTDTLRDYLREKQLMLVLDNFEQIVKAAPIVSELLTASLKLKLIVTSREVLRLRGEHDYAISPLGLPERGRKQTVAVLSQYEAVALFIQRAKAANSNFEITDENGPAIAEICARLDGLPLAIEIAAARIRMLTPQKMLEKLSDRLKTLTGGARDLPARQQTIRGAIDWSYNLLDESEKTLFARLGVFVGGWTLEAAEAVCGNKLDLGVADGLESLLDKSLIRQAVGLNDDPRFTMLETIREYAAEKLAQSNEGKALRRGHSEYFAALADQAWEGFKVGREHEWLLQVSPEFDNIRAMLAWLLEHQNAEVIVRVAASLGPYHERLGLYREGIYWLDKGLAMDQALPPHVRAFGLRRLAVAIADLGIDREIGSITEEALAIYRDLGDQEGAATCLNNLASFALSEGDYSRSYELYDEALALHRALGNLNRVAFVLKNISMLRRVLGDFAAARTYLEEATRLARESADELLLHECLGGLVWLALSEGAYDEALGQIQEMEAIAARIGAIQTITTGHMFRGLVSLQVGDLSAAQTILSKALSEAHEHEFMALRYLLLAGVASTTVRLGNAHRAAQLFGAADARGDNSIALVPLDKHPFYQSDVASARASLGDSAFEAAWESGRAMAIDQAIAYALEEN